MQERQDRLAQSTWFTGCKNTPYLVKSCFYYQEFGLFVTDLIQSWQLWMNKQQILKQKAIYNQTLQIKQLAQLLDLLVKGFKYGNKSKLSFRKVNQKLQLTLQMDLGIYPFNWKFVIHKSDRRQRDVLNAMLIKPLVSTVHSQQKCLKVYQKRCQKLQNDYIKRLPQNQKNKYNKWILKQEQYQLYTDQSNQFPQLNFDKTAQFLFKNNMPKRKQVKMQIKQQQKKVQMVNKQLDNDYEIKRIIQTTGRIQKKKKRKPDFI